MHRQHYQRWINQNHMDALYEKQHGEVQTRLRY